MEEKEINYIPTVEAMRLSGYSHEYIRMLLRQGKVNGQRFGSIWQVNKQSLLDYLKSQEKNKEG